MKRFLKLTCCLILLIFLVACGEKTTETMYLAPAKLTKEEQGILDLLEVTPDQVLIYDFSLEDGIEKLEVNLYELEDGTVDTPGHFSGRPQSRNEFSENILNLCILINSQAAVSSYNSSCRRHDVERSFIQRKRFTAGVN